MSKRVKPDDGPIVSTRRSWDVYVVDMAGTLFDLTMSAPNRPVVDWVNKQAAFSEVIIFSGLNKDYVASILDKMPIAYDDIYSKMDLVELLDHIGDRTFVFVDDKGYMYEDIAEWIHPEDIT